MARKSKEIDFEAEYRQHVAHLHTQVGRPVPLSCSYTQCERPILISINGDSAILRFRNGAELVNVPLRDLVNNSGYWRG